MKKLAALLTAITLVATTVFAAPVNYGAELTNQPTKSYSQTFKDVPKSYWAFSYISEMVSRGVLSGYPDGYFYPENNITRAEFAKIMTCAAGLTIDEKAGTNYDDVIWDDWSVPYIEAAKYYLSGYTTPDGSIYYFPDDLALREDIAVALVKLKGYSTIGYDLSILQAMFTDWQSISEGARKYVSVAIDQGLISGYDDRTFRGQQGITRAEAATLLWRAYQYGNGNKSFELVPEVIEKPDTKKEEIKREEFEKEEIKKKTDNIFKDANDNYEEEYNNYSYELSTLVPNVSTVNALVIVKGSLIYQTGNKLYKVDIDTGEREEFFDAEDIGIIVDGDIDKETRYNLESAMLAIGYNSADDHLYAFIEQDTEVYRIDWSQSIYIYDIEKNEKIGSFCLYYNTESPDSNYMRREGYGVINIDENNKIPVERFSYKQIIDINTDNEDLDKIIDIGSLATYNYIDGAQIKADVNSIWVKSNRTGENEQIDVFCEGIGKRGNYFTTDNNKYIYFTTGNDIYKSDIKGNCSVVCTFDDIDNVDNKIIDLSTSCLAKNTSIADKDGTIIYWDKKNCSIRKISKK